MKKSVWIVLSLLLILSMTSCGAAKRRLQEKMLDAVEAKAEEMGVSVDLDDVDLTNGLVEGLAAEALEEALEPGVESLQKQLEEAFSDEALEGFAESMGALESSFERDEEGNIINMHFEDESGVINLDGSTEWPPMMPAHIPVVEDGMILTYQVEEEESITVVIMNTSEEYVRTYIATLKGQFETVIESEDSGLLFVGKTDKDGIVLGYEEGGLSIQYHLDTDFVQSWQG